MSIEQLLGQHQGQYITDILVGPQSVSVLLAGGTVLYGEDVQSCCESRYFDYQRDEIRPHFGARLLRIEERGFTSEPRPDGEACTDKQFLDIVTSTGVLTLTCYNQHSGYYGGFYLRWWKGSLQ